MPSFHEYASWWLQAKVDGVMGHKPIDANTRADYRWRLTAHLLPLLRRLPAGRDRPAGEYQARRAVCGTLARSGIRASELCDLRIGHVRLHDPGGARFRIPDAKTEAGIREVQMSPELVEEFVSHVDRLRRAGQPTDPDG